MARKNKAVNTPTPAPIPGPASEDATARVRKYFERRWPRLAIAAVILAVAFGAIEKTEIVWKFLEHFRSAVDILAITPAHGNPDTFDVVLRNNLAEAVEIRSVELEVQHVDISQETFGGSSTLPATEHYDAILEPHAGYKTKIQGAPAQIFPNNLDRFQVRLVTKPSGRAAEIEYLLLLRVYISDKKTITSAPFTAAMLVQH